MSWQGTLVIAPNEHNTQGKAAAQEEAPCIPLPSPILLHGLTPLNTLYIHLQQHIPPEQPAKTNLPIAVAVPAPALPSSRSADGWSWTRKVTGNTWLEGKLRCSA